jgi:hypothetical protein
MNTARNVDMEQNIAVDSDRMTAEIDLKENAVYRVVDGQITLVDKPNDGYGKQTITWHQGKPSLCEISYTIK